MSGCECKPDRAQPLKIMSGCECKPDAKRKRDSAQPERRAQPLINEVIPVDRDRFDEIAKFRIPDISELRLPRGSAKMILAGVAALVMLVLLWSSFYQVQPEELGVVLRFGRHTRTTEPVSFNL